MLHDTRHDPEFGGSPDAIRRQLDRAKARVKLRYPNGRIRWVLKTCNWVVVDADTGEIFETSGVLDSVATGEAMAIGHPESGTHCLVEREKR